MHTLPYLYLLFCVSGPHIAAVTLAAYECQSTDFPQPPYPDSIVCPDSPAGAGAGVTIWDILSKVRVEAFCWGAGTAIGELPPYFMARAARLSGTALQCSGSGMEKIRIRYKHPGSATLPHFAYALPVRYSKQSDRGSHTYNFLLGRDPFFKKPPYVFGPALKQQGICKKFLTGNKIMTILSTFFLGGGGGG